MTEKSGYFDISLHRAALLENLIIFMDFTSSIVKVIYVHYKKKNQKELNVKRKS